MDYPVTKKENVYDTYHGVKVHDPYRWLEQMFSPGTIDWSEKQSMLTKKYLDEIPYKESIRKKMQDIQNNPRYGHLYLSRSSNKIFYPKNDGLEDSESIFFRNGINGEEQLFISPKEFSENAQIQFKNLSTDEKYAGVVVRHAGQEWSEIKIIEIETRKILPDEIKWCKFTNIEFWKDGFFYLRFDVPAGEQEKFESPKNQRICFHKLGTDQSDDSVIIDPNSKLITLGNMPMGQFDDIDCEIFENKYLVVHCFCEKSYKCLVKDLRNEESEFELLIDTPSDNLCWPVGYMNDKLILLSSEDAPNNKVISIDLKHPKKNDWKTVIPEGEYALNQWGSIACACNKIYATYIKDVKSMIYQYDEFGNFEHEIKVPFICKASIADGSKNDEYAFMRIESFTCPPTIYVVDPKTGESKPFINDDTSIDTDRYDINQVFYESFDGTKVPMFLISKKGIGKNPNSPTILYGYGAYRISQLPSFSQLILTTIECGGTYVIANIRGGGEYGEEWHKAGCRENKQNTFSDFISAAEHLINNGYTSRDKLAIYGGSAGGILVAACVNQRPDLFRVAIPASGIHDMLRYQNNSTYLYFGVSDVEDEFQYLYKYSPIHNVSNGTRYPSMIIPVCDNDERVPPFNSYKLIATLQENVQGDNPILLRIQKGGGHYLRNTLSQIDEFVDILVFTLWNMGIKDLTFED